MQRTILHCDLNNFYASVECLKRPALRDVPMAVCGDPKLRHGVVLAKNQLARKRGVRTGEAIWQARQKCPALVTVPPRFSLYLAYSRRVRDIYSQFSPQVEPFGLDECWLDLTGTQRLFGPGEYAADEIRRRIRRETGLTVSVGVSFNKIFAKLASDQAEPDTVFPIPAASWQQTVWPLPAGALLYAGKSACAKLASYGVRTVGELAQSRCAFLESLLGKQGVMLWRYANGLDQSPVAGFGEAVPVKSIGNSVTTPHDLTEASEIRPVLYALCERVSARLRAQELKCTVVQLHMRDSTLYCIQRQAPAGAFAVCTTQELFQTAFRLYLDSRGGIPCRSLGVRACGLVADSAQQISYLPEAQMIHRHERLEGAVDQIRTRFGAAAIQRGILMQHPVRPGLSAPDALSDAPVAFSRR
ncbi:MAG: DNA polymerase IV [Clostridiales bacterium]|nr:DNA polymerase IV [Clostridiales bacterium]